MIQLALRSALSDRAAEGNVVVVDAWGFAAPRTKDAVAALVALGVEGRVLVVADRDDTNTWKSFANLSEVHVLSPGELNAYDVLVSDVVVFSRDTLPSGGPAAAVAPPVAEAPAADDSADEPAGDTTPADEEE
jgi:large subunit ribosomal protein L4